MLIGINDTWHRVDQKREFVPDNEWGNMYACMLGEVKDKTDAKIIIIEEFLLYVPDKETAFRPDVNNKIGVTRAIARRFADAYVPADGLFAAASVKAPRLTGQQMVYTRRQTAHVFLARHGQKQRLQ